MSTLLQTAHRGFVRHLPVVGPLSDEIQAFAEILRTDPGHSPGVRSSGAVGVALRATEPAGRVAGRWRSAKTWSDSPSGDVTALYRLQKNPLVIALFDEPRIDEIAGSVRPTELAERLREGQRGTMSADFAEPHRRRRPKATSSWSNAVAFGRSHLEPVRSAEVATRV